MALVLSISVARAQVCSASNGTLPSSPSSGGTTNSSGDLTSYAGETITPISYTSATTADYNTFTSVTAGSQPDINPADTTTWTQAFVDNFSTLSVWSSTNGSGTWLEGSPNNINGETEFYPTAAQIATVGSNPFSVSNGVLSINLTPLNSGYANDVQNSSQQWQSGRLDTSNLPGLYAEGGELYMEVTAQVSASPYAWPAFWALARDAVYPLEYDTMEVFGNPQTSYDATIHYTSPNVSGNNTMATRVTTSGANLSASYHVYGYLANWKTKTLSAYFDHHFVGSMTVNTDPQGFDKEVYLILDQATGGEVSSPAAGTTFPITYNVKQVAAYYNINPLIPAPVSGTQPETTAYLAALATQPSSTWVTAFNNMIVAAKNLGFFTSPYKPAHWYVFATDHQQDALVDIMNPKATAATIQGSGLGWTADKGFKGNGGGGWIDTGYTLSGVDETNYGMGAWITSLSATSYGGGLIETAANGNDLRLESTNAGAVVFDLGTQYGAQSETALDTAVGWFGLSTFADSGSTYADTVTMMAGLTSQVEGEQVSNATALPSSDVLFLKGDDGAASIELGGQWHQPRQKMFRDQVLHPFLLAIGAVSQ